MATIREHREFMKSGFAALHGVASDQAQGLPQPPLQLPVNAGAEVLDLPPVDPGVLANRDLYALLKGRRSRREFTAEPLSAAELSFLLWATQGVEEVVRGGYCTLRPVPSGGARHPFETYLFVQRVAGVAAGVYRYLPLSHQLVLHLRDLEAMRKVAAAACDQAFLAESAVVFVWSCVPYRGEWRYLTKAHKVMLLDAGHVCQNLYLACEAVGCGTCAVAAYDQAAMDGLLRLDGDNEYVIYLAPVGKRRAE